MAYVPMEPGRLSSVAVVRSDPEPINGGWRLVLQLHSGQRLDAAAFGRAGFQAQQVEVGQVVNFTGRIKPVGDRPWLRSRHIVGRISVDSLEIVGPGDRFNQLVNSVRAMVADGAVGFDQRDKALYLGLVIGDDRFQPLSQQAQFRAAGLTHLLAVSGQNVAFVLLVASPILLRCGYRLRIVLIVIVLAVFVGVTRAEPSVLRASSAALVAAWAALTGRPRSGVRILSAGVSAMVLIDPFLVHVVAFQLSVAASAGIIILSPALVTRIPLPSVLSEAMAVTLAAQLGVAPLLIGYFGPLPLAAIPANLLAGWAAGAVMTAGLTLGPLAALMARAGLEGPSAVIQLPTRLLVDWIDVTARWNAALPMPRLNGVGLLIVVAIVAALALRPRRGVGAHVMVVMATFGLTIALMVSMPVSLAQPTELESGAAYFPATDGSTPSVLLIPGDCSSTLIDELLVNNIGTIDVVITESGGRGAGRLVTAVGETAEVGVILAPPMHRIKGATRVTSTRHIETAWTTIVVDVPDEATGLVIAAAGVAG